MKSKKSKQKQKQKQKPSRQLKELTGEVRVDAESSSTISGGHTVAKSPSSGTVTINNDGNF
ncbi:MAG: hypothetical protein KC777_14965 [Cyanobacteria bacterium HKST-UBA02]|nr:hypothetical protein [Cyanobacteria bacterium HKST-UBA02]